MLAPEEIYATTIIGAVGGQGNLPKTRHFFFEFLDRTRMGNTRANHLCVFAAGYHSDDEPGPRTVRVEELHPVRGAGRIGRAGEEIVIERRDITTNPPFESWTEVHTTLLSHSWPLLWIAISVNYRLLASRCDFDFA